MRSMTKMMKFAAYVAAAFGLITTAWAATKPDDEYRGYVSLNVATASKGLGKISLQTSWQTDDAMQRDYYWKDSEKSVSGYDHWEAGQYVDGTGKRPIEFFVYARPMDADAVFEGFFLDDACSHPMSENAAIIVDCIGTNGALGPQSGNLATCRTKLLTATTYKPEEATVYAINVPTIDVYLVDTGVLEPIKIYAKFTKPVTTTYVAQIGETKYETLAAAVAAAQPGDTVTLLADVELADKLTVTKRVILDLNGKTISHTANCQRTEYHMIDVGVGGDLTIKDTAEGGTIVFTGNPYDTGYGVQNATIYNCGGKLTLESGTVKNLTDGGLTYAIVNSSNAWADPITSIFEMKGGVVSAPHGDAAIRQYMNAGATIQSVNTVTISGGTILDTGIFVDTVSYQQINPNMVGTLNITSGTINGLIDFKIRNDRFTANITGGTFTNSKMWARLADDTYLPNGVAAPFINITGGVWNFVGTAFGLGYDTMTTTWKDGANPFAVAGGTFSEAIPENSCAAGFIPTSNEDGTYGVREVTYVAMIGETKYETVAEAVAAAKSGDTVKLLVDAEETQRIYVGKNITVTIDLNGMELTSSADKAVLLGEGSNLSISNGDLIAAKKGIYADGANATATIAADAYVEAAEWVMCSSGQANTTFNVYGEAYCEWRPTIQLESENSTVNLDGAYVESFDYYAVYVNGSYSGNTVNIHDSTILSVQYLGVYVSNQYGKPFQTLNISGDTTITGWTAVEVKHTNVTIGEGVKLIATDEPSFEDSANGECTFGWSFATTRNGASDQPTGTITVTGGEFTGPFGIPSEITNTDKVSVSVTGGIYDTDPSAYVAEGYEAVAQGTTPETWVVGKAPVAQIGETKYETLAEAVAAATAGQTVTLLADIATDVSTKVAKTLTIDLNGHTLHRTGASTGSEHHYGTAIYSSMANITLTVVDSSEEKTGVVKSYHYGIMMDGGSLVVDGITIQSGDKHGIYMDSGNADGSLTAQNCTITGEAADAIGVYNGKNHLVEDCVITTKDAGYSTITKEGTGTLTISDTTINCANTGIAVNKGKLVFESGAISSAGEAAISTHGMYTGSVEIRGGTIAGTGTDSFGVYFPSNGELTISGGTISGKTGVAVKGGTVSISEGATIIGNGEAKTYATPNKSGANNTGDALYIEANYGKSDGVMHNISVNITGGTFTSEHGHAVAARFKATTTHTLPTINIAGGTFTSASGKDVLTTGNDFDGTLKATGGIYSALPATDYVATGYEAVARGTTPETWVVREESLEFNVPVEDEQTIPVAVPKEVFENPVDKDGNMVDVSTPEQKAEYVNSEAANGMKVWQNVAMGVDGTQATNVIEPVEGVATPAEKTDKVEPVVITTPIAAFNAPESAATKVAVKYNLLKGMMNSEGRIVWAAQPVAVLDTPRFVVDVKEDTGDTYWKIEAVFKSVK